MDKPLLLRRQEFLQNLVLLINESNLPFVVIEPILNNTLEEVRSAIQQEYNQQKKEYEESLEQEVEIKDSQE